MSKIPWDDIDEEMHPVVRILNDEGIITFASCCEGLRVGHGEGWPWVNCRISDDYGEADIINALMKHGYVGFSAKNVRFVNSRKKPIKDGEKYHFWNLEFWNEEFGVVTKPRGEET